ncbi:HalOD1 output domain-containing protein [Halovenus sp. HT40]|uniref:HalOD1 output domain-containing protein n=1 Tax=Halovenus sp. HT40 TaxID=3126691 RepID=UPI00300F0C7E
MDGPNRTAPSNDGVGEKQVYIRGESETAAESVVRAVSKLTGADPEAMDPLYDVVDPDALNTLCDPDLGDEGSSPRVSFQFSSCKVVVYGDGRTIVSRAIRG